MEALQGRSKDYPLRRVTLAITITLESRLPFQGGIYVGGTPRALPWALLCPARQAVERLGYSAFS